MTLEPIDPETAVELYLEDRSNELAASSLKSHEYQLAHFVRWCEKADIENLNTLTGRLLHRFRLWRREDGNLNKVSEKKQMDTFRIFIRWLEAVDGVEQDLSAKVQSPSLSRGEDARKVMLESERASEILAYMGKYHYASVEHVSTTLAWHTMMRTGSIHALDVGDYNRSDQYLEVRHRPDTGTPIKNKSNGERLVALSDQMCELLDDWLATKRPDVTDSQEREPLLASNLGRLAKSTIRTYVYHWTRPCVIGADCPHGRDIEECEARDRGKYSKCPSSVSPHAIRRGSITHRLNSDWPETAVSGRANVSQMVLRRHYDSRSERERMEKRRGYLDNL